MDPIRTVSSDSKIAVHLHCALGIAVIERYVEPDLVSEYDDRQVGRQGWLMTSLLQSSGNPPLTSFLSKILA